MKGDDEAVTFLLQYVPYVAIHCFLYDIVVQHKCLQDKTGGQTINDGKGVACFGPVECSNFSQVLVSKRNETVAKTMSGCRSVLGT